MLLRLARLHRPLCRYVTSSTDSTLRFVVNKTYGANTRTFAAQERIEFLQNDLSHLFDDVGLDQSQYDDIVKFRDPITRFNSVKGELSSCINMSGATSCIVDAVS